ncbi:MAG: hypothetical protein II007_09485 [Gammaproteobacteria bacterium]|nr:hypothetical protein [Gammaproteobacteria bacterium]
MSFKELTLVGAMALALAACGGGGGGGGSGDTPPVLSFPGSTAEAVLSPTLAAPFVNAVLGSSDIGEEYRQDFGPDAPTGPLVRSLLHPAVRMVQSGPQHRETINEQLACYTGSATVSGSVDDTTLKGTVTFTYNECGDPDDGSLIILNGSYSVRFDRWYISAGSQIPLDYTVTFNNFSARPDYGNAIVLNGTEVTVNGDGCDGVKTANIVRTGASVADSLYFKNYVKRGVCSTNQEAGGISYRRLFSGDVYVGSLGHVVVSTPEPLLLEHRHVPSFGGWADLLGAGTLKLTSANGSVTISGRLETQYTDDSKRYRSAVSFDTNADNTADLAIDVPSWYLTHPTLADFGDNDQDGMWNGWERFYGLNPNVDDADLDLDADGYKNYIEFASNSDPTDLYDQPQAYAVIEVVDPQANGWGAYESHVYVGDARTFELKIATTSINPAIAKHFQTFTLEANLSERGTWAITSHYDCSVLTEGQPNPKLRCLIPAQQLLDSPESLDIGSLQFAPTTATQAGDAGTNFVLMAGSDITIAQTNWTFYSLASSGNVGLLGGSRAFIIGETNEPAAYEVLLKGFGEGTPESVSMTVTLSPDSTATSFTGVISNGSASNFCTVTATQISCNGDLYAYQDLTLQLARPTEQGHVTLSFSIHAKTGVVINSTHAQRIIAFGQSSDVLQSLIDYAIPVDGVREISVAEGIYIGGLSLPDQTRLIGEEGTEIWLADGSGRALFNFEARSIFASGSVSMEGMDVYVFGAGVQANGGEFINNQFHLMGNSSGGALELSGIYPFIVDGNRFVAAETLPLGAQESWEVYERTFIRIWSQNNFDSSAIQNNLFVDSGDYATAIYLNYIAVPLSIRNNTAINIGRFINAESAGATTVYLTNNLIANTNGALAKGTDGVYAESMIVASNLFPGSYSALGGSNIFTDEPRLDNDSYAPLAGSPAIDAGVDLSTDFTTDLLGNPRPVGAGFDIGAIEVQAP